MYDLAKRSLAFAVATGGLLLTGAAYSPALAAVGFGANQGPIRTQGVLGAAGFASSPVNAASPARVARVGSAVRDSGTLASAEGFRIPIEFGRELCGEGGSAGAARADDSDSPCTSTAEGSAPTVPGSPAPGSGGASATAVSMVDGGTGADIPVQTPIMVPAPASGSRVTSADAQDAGYGGTWSAPLHVPAGTRKPCPCTHRPTPPPPPKPTAPPCLPCMHRTTPPPPPPTSPPTGPCTCTHRTTPPPPSTTPPTTPPTSWYPPPPSTPPTTPPTTRGTTPPPPPSTPPTTRRTTPPPPPHTHPGRPPGGGGLAHTGADIGIALGVAGAALLGGLGLRAAARKREEQ